MHSISGGTIRFQPDVPQTLTLKSTTPVSMTGQYGPQAMFETTDGKKVYLSPGCANHMLTCGIEAGIPFTACKTTVEGRVSWKFTPQPKRPAQPVAAALDAGEPEPHEATSRPRTRFEQALQSAVAAAHSAEEFGKRIGYQVHFTPGDIRAMGISAYIGMQQEGR